MTAKVEGHGPLPSSQVIELKVPLRSVASQRVYEQDRNAAGAPIINAKAPGTLSSRNENRRHFNPQIFFAIFFDLKSSILQQMSCSSLLLRHAFI